MVSNLVKLVFWSIWFFKNWSFRNCSNFGKSWHSSAVCSICITLCQLDYLLNIWETESRKNPGIIVFSDLRRNFKYSTKSLIDKVRLDDENFFCESTRGNRIKRNLNLHKWVIVSLTAKHTRFDVQIFWIGRSLPPKLPL